MFIHLLKSIFRNLFVIVVGFFFASLGVLLDFVLGIQEHYFFLLSSLGFVLILIGFLIRVWATYYFYKSELNVIVLHAQKTLVTDGPFAFSRNPLYLGGNVFIFLGASFLLGTPMGVVITLLHLPLLTLMILREEKQLKKKFGKEWTTYKKHVRRWI